MKYKTKITARTGWYNIKSYHIVFSFIFCLLISCTLGTAHAEALPQVAKLLPPETILLVEIDNFQQLRQQFEKTSFYKLYKDPAMAKFVKDFETKLKEKTSQIDNDIIAAFFDADVLPQGKVGFALVPGEKIEDVNEPPLLFITQWGENSTKIKEAVEKVVNKTIENGARKKSEDYRGVSIETIINKDKSKFNYSFIDGCLIGGRDIETLKFVIAHIKGASSPTLADDADYTSTLSSIGPYHDINFYLNIKQIIKKAVNEDSSESFKELAANLGFDNVVSMGCSVGLARTPNTSYQAKLIVKINGAKKGIYKMLEAESAVLRVPRFIPVSVSSITFFNLDIKKAYSELANILAALSPESASMLYMPLISENPEGESALYLKKDIIDHLGSQIITAQSVDKSDSGKLPKIEYLIALAVNDSRSLEKSMSLLHSKIMAAGQPEAKRELLGHMIYLFSSRGLPFIGGQSVTPMQAPVDSQRPKMPKLAFTITDTHIIFGTENNVEKAIRTLESNASASLTSAKWFNKTKSNIPSVVGLASLEDDTVSAEAFWNMMKKSNKIQDLSAISAISPIQIAPVVSGLFDFTLLPDFGAVRKYFGQSTLYGISREDGFFFECKDIISEDSD